MLIRREIGEGEKMTTICSGALGRGEELGWGDGIGDPNLVQRAAVSRSQLTGPDVLGNALSRQTASMVPASKWHWLSQTAHALGVVRLHWGPMERAPGRGM